MAKAGINMRKRVKNAKTTSCVPFGIPDRRRILGSDWVTILAPKDWTPRTQPEATTAPTSSLTVMSPIAQIPL